MILEEKDYKVAFTFTVWVIVGLAAFTIYLWTEIYHIQKTLHTLQIRIPHV